MNAPCKGSGFASVAVAVAATATTIATVAAAAAVLAVAAVLGVAIRLLPGTTAGASAGANTGARHQLLAACLCTFVRFVGFVCRGCFQHHTLYRYNVIMF